MVDVFTANLMAVSTERPFFVEPLKDMCVTIAARTFALNPTFEGLDARTIERIVDLLPLDLHVEMAGKVIMNESYWRRRSQARWENCDIAGHGRSWKQLYFEKNIEDALETFDPESSDISQLRRLLLFSRKYVSMIRIQQLPSHIDLTTLFDGLGSSLRALVLSYGMKNVAMDYDRSLFGMKLPDIRSLTRAIANSDSITSLFLSSNQIDDEKLKVLSSGLLENMTITQLDLSQNKISDRGARALAKVLDSRNVIDRLSLSDNFIHIDGGRALARALKTSMLRVLDLKMNRIGDEGAREIFSVLADNKHLESLSVSANGLTGECKQELRLLIERNSKLRHLDISCNDLGEECGTLIRQALEYNDSLKSLVVRSADFNPEDEYMIHEMIMIRNL